MIDFGDENRPVPEIQNLIGGEWLSASKTRTIISPLDGTPIFVIPDTRVDEMDALHQGLKETPKSGLHNAFKNPERMKMLAEVTRKAAAYLSTEEGFDYFTRLVQMVMPKSRKQCEGEVAVTRAFLRNFTGDRVRFLHTGVSSPGDHAGQQPNSYPWPYGPVGLIYPFNFPIEIPVLQLMGALYMGNRPFVKGDSKVAIVMYEFLRLLESCGLPMEDVDFINCRGDEMGEFLEMACEDIQLIQFTGSSETGEKVSKVMRGRVRLEDAGFDWKILGPDVPSDDAMRKCIAWQCDQDAYNASGQKCSAESILFVHERWQGTFLFEDMKEFASKRNLDDLSIGPVITWTTERMLEHIESLLAIEGSELLFGGAELKDHQIPECYGALEPTAVQVPFTAIQENFDLVMTEVFGPLQVVVVYEDSALPDVLALMESMKNHLTAAVVSNDPEFQQKVLGATVNGTTYVGWRARTTGAPQNHFFGPAADPRGAGIGTDKSILMTWACHREIITDWVPVPKDWTPPAN